MRKRKKYEHDIIIGTFLTLIGYLLLLWIGFYTSVSWIIIIVGKLIIFLTILEYKDYRRMLRGEQLHNDNFVFKRIRKWRRKRYWR